MNCKLTHEHSYVKFEYDTWKDSNGKEFKTVIIFEKESKSFSISNALDFYGHGSTLKIKEMKYAIRYLENKKLLD